MASQVLQIQFMNRFRGHINHLTRRLKNKHEKCSQSKLITLKFFSTEWEIPWVWHLKFSILNAARQQRIKGSFGKYERKFSGNFIWLSPLNSIVSDPKSRQKTYRNANYIIYAILPHISQMVYDYELSRWGEISINCEWREKLHCWWFRVAIEMLLIEIVVEKRKILHRISTPLH